MVRLVLVLITFLLSLLCIFRAPTLLLWYAAILVTEFPLIFLVTDLVLLSWSLWLPGIRITETILLSIAFMLFLSPIIRSYTVSASLKSQVVMQLGLSRDTSPLLDQQPFSFWKMLTGLSNKPIAYKRLTYRVISQDTLTMDYYPSSVPGIQPCVVVVHGGSWSGGDSRQLPELNSELAKAGYHVVSIDYRLAPKHISPAPVEDLEAALDYLRQHSSSLKIDSSNFVLLGRSAGGQIVLQAAYTLREPGIKAVISFYGPTDMVWGYKHPANPLVLKSDQVLSDYLGGSYETVPHNYVSSSPAYAVSPQSVPTLLIHGRNDVLVDFKNAAILGQQLQKSGVKHFILDLPWATHGCDYTLNGPTGQLSTYTVKVFIDHFTRPESL